LGEVTDDLMKDEARDPLLLFKGKVSKHREGIINEELPTFVGSFYFVFNTS
jgi:hypothetical protein